MLYKKNHATPRGAIQGVPRPGEEAKTGGERSCRAETGRTLNGAGEMKGPWELSEE